MSLRNKLGEICSGAKAAINAVWQKLAERFPRLNPNSDQSKSRRFAEEREFLPAAIEIMETPANPIGRTVALSLAGFFTIALAWSVIGEVDVVAVAQGRLVPTGGVKQIQPLEIGTVRAIHVRDGQHVSAGDLLIELDPTESEADKGQLLHERDAAALDIARLKTFLDGLDRREIPPLPKHAALNDEILQTAEQKLRSDLAAFFAKLAAKDAEAAKLRAERASIKAEIAKSRELLPLLVEREGSLSGLVSDGISTKPVWLEVKQQLIETKSNLEIYRNRLEEADASIMAAEKDRENLIAQTKQQTLEQLLEARNKFQTAVITLRKAESREDRHQLRAPVSGTIQQLAVHTVRGVVSPAESLMVVVPDDVELEAVAKVQNKDAGFVATEQDAVIKIDSFPFTRYGKIDGKVKSISRDAIQDEDLGLVYEVRATLQASEIFADGRMVKLTPGMTASVEVKTGKRRIIEFLLSPVMKYGDEALRER
ncbi:HlyD family type I secretion periplasmic adaptor subunit [Thalassospira povalilytica]|uniref:Membrane fusion protein (MFP) family protein n=1 Tax=Thalassospira povalilytica TaxID=732237 RepID=A0A8I1M675_9PROT|nr:HlyD family type I secretion periplasmic adaptor subunit [Thalassospira povalilytica]MBN8196033.1 HlyD family type I secretion periplasmic adaptor subunit [Thalassospira povalilytica]